MNHFASKMSSLNVLQNVAIYLFKYLFRTLWQFLKIIHLYTTEQIKFPCVG